MRTGNINGGRLLLAFLLAATPITTSACGFAFSASSFAVITPVESRTHLISIVGLSFTKPAS